MRKIFFAVAALLLYGCQTGLIKKELKNNLFEKFDYESWVNDYKDLQKGIKYGSYIYKGVEFRPTSAGDEEAWYIYIYPQKHQFYTAYYQYDKKKYTLKKKGKVLGWNPEAKDLKIGIWYEYDEQGKLIKETDEDKKFGKFGYNELLLFLDKEKKISLREGLEGDINRDHKMDIAFYYSDSSNKKLWDVFVHMGSAQAAITPPGETGDRMHQPGKTYLIDGNTGAVIKRNEDTLNYYKEIMENPQ